MTADRDAKLDRIEQVINTWPDRCFAFDEFGPLTIRPVGGRSWYVILDNLSAHKGTKTRCWAASHQVELCFTPTCSSWANPIELHFGPLREFVLNNSNHPNHAVLTGSSRPTSAGATPTPATPTSSPPNAENEPESGPSSTADGADPAPPEPREPWTEH